MTVLTEPASSHPRQGACHVSTATLHHRTAHPLAEYHRVTSWALPNSWPLFWQDKIKCSHLNFCYPNFWHCVILNWTLSMRVMLLPRGCVETRGIFDWNTDGVILAFIGGGVQSRDGWHPAMVKRASLNHELPTSCVTFDTDRDEGSFYNYRSLEHDSFLYTDIKHFEIILTYPEFSNYHVNQRKTTICLARNLMENCSANTVNAGKHSWCPSHPHRSQERSFRGCRPPGEFESISKDT